MISYAQNFEDVMLMRALGHVSAGFYVDVGAQHPVNDSVSLAFYQRGWRGVHIEPVPHFAQLLREARPDEQVVQAVACNNAEPMMFYAIADTGMSTGDPAIAKQHLENGFEVTPILAPSVRLSAILDSAQGAEVHWLKIDAEGMERSVLESWGDSPVRPWIVVVESTKPNSQETTHREWEPLITRRGYACAYFDGLNQYYVSAEHPELIAAFAIPPNYFDDFSVTRSSIFSRQPADLLRQAEAEGQAHKDRVEQELRRGRSLEEALAVSRHNLLVVEATVVEREKALAEAQQAIEAGAQALTAQQQALDGSRQALGKAQQALDSTERTAKAREQDLIAAEEALDASREALGRTEQALKAAEQALAARERSLLASQEALDASRRALGQTEQALEAVEHTLATRERSLLESQEALAASRQALGDAQQALGSTQRSLEARERSLLASQEALDASQARLKAAEQALDATRRDLDELQHRFGDHRAESYAVHRRLTAERRALEQELSAIHAANHAHHTNWRDAELRLADAERSLAEVRASHSWRITAPLRATAVFLRWFRLGLSAWLLMKPGARPHRLAQRLKAVIKAAMPAAPVMRARPVSPPAAPAPATPSTMTAALMLEGDVRLVFVDHTIACPTNTGVQRVVRGLSKIVLQSGRPVRFVKWSEEAGGCVLIDREERAHLARWNGPAISAAEADHYPATGSPPVRVMADAQSGGRLLVPEVTHITFQPAPVTRRVIEWAKQGGLKTCFIFYDAIPLRRAEFASAAPVHAQYMRELRLADAVWPISRWSADELASFWGVDNGADASYLPDIRPIPLPAEFDRPRVTAPAHGERLILSVGTLEPRKNQLALIKAFQSVLAERPDAGWRLVLVGNLHPHVAHEVREATGPGSAISFLGHVSDAELSNLYARCAFTVFPSVEEGFGLPILESLWQGKPCLCADFGAMGEVADGGGCLAIDTRDPERLKAGLVRLMDEPALRQSLSLAAIARPITTWADYAGEMERGQIGAKTLVYYWIDSTIAYHSNSGIQRVARQLARGLIEAGFALVPVKWGGVEQPFCSVSREELEHMARWNGPVVDSWAAWTPPQSHRGDGWFIMTELPLNLSDAEQKMVRATAEAAGLRTAAVFHDAIPWKMRDIYPPAFASAHLAYMRELANYTVILPNSHYSRQELIGVLGEDFGIPEAELGHIIACPLPAEFPQPPASHAAAPADGIVRILCVGTVEPRKNHERLLDGFEVACAKSAARMHLTLVGGGHSIEPDLAVRVRARVDANPLISWEQKADDARIQQLYSQCDFTVYPSVEEGFGMPILESLWYGRPVICANFGAMLEVAAEGGGCVTVDVKDAGALADAISDLANDPPRRQALADEARGRQFRSWADYADDVAAKLGLWAFPRAQIFAEHRTAMGLTRKPTLSVCISTYNRAEWLRASLRNIARLYPEPIEGVEFLVCDNAAQDDTPQVVAPYLLRPDFVYRRNPVNVGMLGNLRETARAANGDYLWILGDDDLIRPGSVERVLAAIRANPGVALVYLNYAYTRIEDARTVVDFERFFADATPIVPPEGDLRGPIREICARNENFFTAIYTLVFRRDHALAAYGQDTSGRPFSTMLTCIPTTYYALNHMMEEPGVWIGEPQLVVNMNVSWMRYAPLWILERIPEVYETAQSKGVPAEDMDRWRRHTLPGVAHFFAEIYGADPLNNAAYFQPARLVARFSHLPEFETYRDQMLEVYRRAHAEGHPAASLPPAVVFGMAQAAAERVEAEPQL